MTKLKLKNILSELLKEIGETHPIHKDINDKLLQIAKRGSDAEEKETIKEDSNIKNIDISYAYPGQRFYSININSKKISDHKEANQIIKDLTGLDLPERAYFDDPEIGEIVKALRAKNIEADSSEQSVD